MVYTKKSRAAQYINNHINFAQCFIHSHRSAKLAGCEEPMIVSVFCCVCQDGAGVWCFLWPLRVSDPVTLTGKKEALQNAVCNTWKVEVM